MIIRNISLNHFKKFDNLVVSLLPGLNVIKGPNEAGKSTLHSAVVAGLFFNPYHRRAEIKSNISWNSDKMYEIGMRVEQDGNEYALTKDFENKRMQITGDGLEHEIIDPSAINQRLCEWLGFSSAAVFRSTACIEQNKISQVTKGEKEIGDILQSTITGEDDSIANDVIATLNSVLGHISEGPGKLSSYASEIEKITSKINELEQEHERIREEVSTTTKSHARLLEIESKLDETNSALQTKINVKEKNERRRALIAELKILEEKFEHAMNSLKLDDEVKSLDERLTAYESFSKLTDEDIEQFYSLLGRKESLEEHQKSLEEQLQHPKQKTTQKRPKLNEFFIAGIVLLWIGLIGTILTKYMLILAFSGLISLCAGIYFMISKSEIQIELSPAQIRNQINRASEQMNFIDESLKYFLSRTKCESIQDFITKLEGYKPLSKRKTEKEAELSGMIGAEAIEDIRQSSKELALMKKQINEELEVLESFALDPEGYQRLLDEVDQLSKERSEFENEKRELEITTSGAKATDEDIATIREKLACWKQKLELFEERRKVTEKCLQFLEKARRKTLRSATNVLEEEIEKYISMITSTRYGKVKVDSETLNVSVYSPEKRDYVDVQNLSRATIDQIYLAARLGLVKLISGNKKPPLLLDDPFVTFDDKRLEATMELLIEISKEYQILLFTCSNRYDPYADKVIDLRTYSILGNGLLAGHVDDLEIEPTIVNDTAIFTEHPKEFEH